MTLGPRLRIGLRRSSLLFWSATLAVAGATGLFVSHQVGEASARAARLGGLREVPVAARPIAAGKVLEGVDVVMRRLPAAAVPDAALARSPAGRPTLVPLAAGEVLLADKLAPEGVHGVAALLPAGMKALAVPVDPAGLALERGHRVDVLATFDVEFGGDHGAVGGGGNAGGESATAGPTDGGERATAGPTDGGERATAGPTDGGERATAGPTDGGERATAGPTDGGERATAGPTAGGERATAGPVDSDESATADPVDSDESTYPGAPTFAVATAALVLDAGEESVTIAVSPDQAPRVAFALARGTVTLALTGAT